MCQIGSFDRLQGNLSLSRALKSRLLSRVDANPWWVLVAPRMVSKAVLENVIFVHQDESNWPLGDGATLKKKFDDIFSATRYTKALEAIRKLKSEQTAQIKEHKLKLETLETRANQAKRLRTNVSEDSEKAAIIANSMKEDEGALQGLRDKMDDLQTTAAQIQSLEEDVRGLKAQRDMKVSVKTSNFNPGAKIPMRQIDHVQAQQGNEKDG
jgi:DNA repair exonuclease SbcCD ATPase subunit